VGWEVHMSNAKSARCSGLPLPGRSMAGGEPGREQKLIQHWSTLSLLYRFAFKTNHLAWKLSMPRYKSQ